MSNLINETAAAEMIGLSVHWLRRKRWSGGGIPFIKVGDGGAVRYRMEDIETYIGDRLRTSTSDHSARQQTANGTKSALR